MPRQKDFSAIPTGFRKYIKTREEWPLGTARTYYMSGYEIVTKTSQNSGKEYTQYYIYLIPTDTVGNTLFEEETLIVFPNQVPDLKDVSNYDMVSVTKTAGEKGDWFRIVNMGKKLEEANRPTPPEYGEVRPAQPKPFANKVLNTNQADANEINIDDIPF